MQRASSNSSHRAAESGAFSDYVSYLEHLQSQGHFRYSQLLRYLRDSDPGYGKFDLQMIRIDVGSNKVLLESVNHDLSPTTQVPETTEYQIFIVKRADLYYFFMNFADTFGLTTILDPQYGICCYEIC